MEQRSYVERGVTDRIIAGMAEARVVGLLGARQAGKTTLVRVIAERELAASYVTLDTGAVRAVAQADPDGFVAGLKVPVVIDEIQRAPALLLAIKRVVDENDAPGQFLITGSANLRRVPTVADALPGRVDYHTLWPFAQAELTGAGVGLLPALFASRPPLLQGQPVGVSGYAKRLVVGGLPESQRRTSSTRDTFLRGYVESLVRRDVADVGQVRDPDGVSRILRLVAARSASLARWDRLGRDAGIDGKTAKAYVDLLESLYLVRVRRPWHRNLGKRQVKAPKLYLADSGLLAALEGVDEQRLIADTSLAGSVVETFAVNEVERLASWTEESCFVWHYREDRREVDMMVERPSGEIVGIEVKSSATVQAADFRGLKHLRDVIGERFRAGVVLHTGSQTLPFGDRLWALPLSSLWTDASALG